MECIEVVGEGLADGLCERDLCERLALAEGLGHRHTARHLKLAQVHREVAIGRI